jgi:hypothetical protein
MILQAVPYFYRQFRSNSWILRYFQATFLVFFAFTMMALNLILGVQRKQPAYAAHLKAALWTYVVVATLLMYSTMSNVTAELFYPLHWLWSLPQHLPMVIAKMLHSRLLLGLVGQNILPPS